MQNIDWTQIFLALITLTGAIITGFLIPYFRKKKEEATANMSAEQRKSFDYWTRVFISVAETVYSGTGLGEKKANLVVELLRKAGLKFDENTIYEAITGLCRELTAQGIINTTE